MKLKLEGFRKSAVPARMVKRLEDVVHMKPVANHRSNVGSVRQPTRMMMKLCMSGNDISRFLVMDNVGYVVCWHALCFGTGTRSYSATSLMFNCTVRTYGRHMHMCSMIAVKCNYW